MIRKMRQTRGADGCGRRPKKSWKFPSRRSFANTFCKQEVTGSNPVGSIDAIRTLNTRCRQISGSATQRSPDSWTGESDGR
jgi:hypothetical protein